MNTEVKARWLKALRSGDYQQGKGALHIQDKHAYCCLGVLCDLAVGAGIGIALDDTITYSDYYTDEDGEGSALKTTTFDRESEYLPGAVQEWAGLADGSPLLQVEGEFVAIDGLNDKRDFTFSQLADLIEEQL